MNSSLRRSALSGPIILGAAVSIFSWVILYLGLRLSPYFPSVFFALAIGSVLSLALLVGEVLGPTRASFAATPEHAEHGGLRSWLYYWTTIVVLGFIAGSGTVTILLGIAQGGPLVVGVGVPITTIYFLVLLSRYSTRSFSQDVRSPLRALESHIISMDRQADELNRLVGRLVTATQELATSAQKLVVLEEKSPERLAKEVEERVPHLWFRAYSTPPTTLSVEVENRGAPGRLNRLGIDYGTGLGSLLPAPRNISAKERIPILLGNMPPKTKALQFRIECEVESLPLGTKDIQSAAFNCTLLKSGWGTPQGVEVSPAEPQDGKGPR